MDSGKQQPVSPSGKKKKKRIIKKRKDGTIISSTIVEGEVSTKPASPKQRRSKSNADVKATSVDTQPKQRRSKSIGRKNTKSEVDKDEAKSSKTSSSTENKATTTKTVASSSTENKATTTVVSSSRRSKSLGATKKTNKKQASTGSSRGKQTGQQESLMREKSVTRKKLPTKGPPTSPGKATRKVLEQPPASSDSTQLTIAPLSSPGRQDPPAPLDSSVPLEPTSPQQAPNDSLSASRNPRTPQQKAKQSVVKSALETTQQPDAKSKVVRIRKHNKTGVMVPSPSVSKKKSIQAKSSVATEPPKPKPDPYQLGAPVYVASSDYSWIPASIVNYDPKTRLARVEIIHNDHLNEATLGVKTYATDASLQDDGKDEGQKAILEIPNASSSTLPLPNLDKTGQAIMAMDDMVDLPFLHEAAILYNLKARHVTKLPYTRTGDIVIAVNPYQWISLYTKEHQLLYAHRLVWDVDGNTSSEQSKKVEDARRTVPPHVYEVSALAYQALARTGQAQSILVSGESGAGKTETVKICMNHMSLVQTGSPGAANKTGSNGMDPVVRRVVESNPLLEVFGNARTRRNDNSSRFGKYVQLQFDRDDSRDHLMAEEDPDETGRSPTSSPSAPQRKIRAKVYGKSATNVKRDEQKEEQKLKKPDNPLPVCKLVGSVCTVYLLEKSRVVAHDPAERTFHIFYALLAASSEEKKTVWAGLVGMSSSDFVYVGETDFQEWDGLPDCEHYAKTCKALSVIGIAGGALQQLMQAIVIVLQCGQIVFEQTKEDGQEHCIVPSDCMEEVRALSELTGVSGDNLLSSFTQKTMITRGETFVVPLSPAGAKDSRDAFAKEVYAKAFLWLVREINAATSAHENYVGTRKASDRSSDFGMIGLLDIFGFESFPTNGFDQLCINYANEKLQAKFTFDVFKTVEAEYIAEGISLDDIQYDDNSDVLDLIESRNGLLALLEQECVRPKGAPREFVYKIRSEHRASKCLIADKQNGKVLGPLEFGVHHYAGEVIYLTDTFLSRNQDVISPDLYKMALESSNEILSKHLTNNSMFKKDGDPGAKQVGDSSNGIQRVKSGSVVDTVWSKFRGQLTRLMKNLEHTKSRYIRCIKPNTLKKPLLMQHSGTVEQLRCAGVIAAVAITRSSFPSRLEHKACLERYQVIFRPEKPFRPRPKNFDVKEELQKVLGQALSDFVPQEQDEGKDSFVLGKTRVYFRAGVLEFLEGKRVDCFDLWANDIQRVARGFFVRKVTRAIKLAQILELYKDKGDVAIPIQSRWRIVMAQKEVKKRKYDKLHGFASMLEQKRSSSITRSPLRKVGKLNLSMWC